MTEKELRLSDEYLYNYFLSDKEKQTDKEKEVNQNWFSLAITPYQSREEYERDNQLASDFKNNNIDTLLLVIAARSERTDNVVIHRGKND